MAYNKTKHLNAAQKYLQQGKIPQAILEYQQILKNEPKDQVTLMTLGIYSSVRVIRFRRSNILSGWQRFS